MAPGTPDDPTAADPTAGDASTADPTAGDATPAVATPAAATSADPTAGDVPLAADASTIPPPFDATTAALIDLMVRAEVLRFGDFVGKSGRRMPYFINFGAFRTGSHLATLGRAYADRLITTFGRDIDVLFGPAYKGIPLAVSAAVALAEHHDLEVGVCFDRKEAKDHGEGGLLVGHPLTDGDRVVIVEDVTTAGTSVRASIPLLQSHADVHVTGLIVGADRRERAGDDDRSALDQLAATFGLTTTALVTIDDIIAYLHDREIDGRRVLTDADLDRIAAYRAEYGAVG
jgi:orotate phosphoribosyltransferase